MIMINLLPHREASRKRCKDIFNIALGASALAGGVLAGSVFLWFQSTIADQQVNNAVLEAEVKNLDGQIKDIAGLEAEIAALRARQQAVEDLQSDRNLPVHLLTELVNQLPSGVYVNKMAQLDQQVTLTGVAQSNERVSELLRNLSNNTPWFAKPELVEITSGTLALSTKEQKRIYNFSIKVKLVRASDAEKSSAAESMPSGIPLAVQPVSPSQP